jgi:hypothetical protein
MTIDIIESTWRYRCTYGTGNLTGELLQRFMESASVMRQGMPLQRFKFEQNVDLVSYDYRIWLLDGRVWAQTLTFAGVSDADPIMTFSANPGWKVSMIATHRTWRDLMVDFRNLLGATLVRIDPV